MGFAGWGLIYHPFLLAFVNSIIFLLFLRDGFNHSFLNFLFDSHRLSLLKNRIFFQTVAFFLFIDNFCNELNKLIVIGPRICQQFRINEYVININFKSSNPWKYNILICLFVDVMIGRQSGLSRLYKLVRDGILNYDGIINKSL